MKFLKHGKYLIKKTGYNFERAFLFDVSIIVSRK